MIDSKLLICISTIFIIILIILLRHCKNKKQITIVNPTDIITAPSPLELFDIEKQTLVLLCYADWCGHCQTIKKQYKKKLVDVQFDNDIIFDMVEESDNTKYLNYRQNIPGFPTLVIVENGKTAMYSGVENIKYVLKNYVNF